MNLMVFMKASPDDQYEEFNDVTTRRIIDSNGVDILEITSDATSEVIKTIPWLEIRMAPEIKF